MAAKLGESTLGTPSQFFKKWLGIERVKAFCACESTFIFTAP
jgi:hypothetical protein